MKQLWSLPSRSRNLLRAFHAPCVAAAQPREPRALRHRALSHLQRHAGWRQKGWSKLLPHSPGLSLQFRLRLFQNLVGRVGSSVMYVSSIADLERRAKKMRSRCGSGFYNPPVLRFNLKCIGRRPGERSSPWPGLYGYFHGALALHSSFP